MIQEEKKQEVIGHVNVIWKGISEKLNHIEPTLSQEVAIALGIELLSQIYQRLGNFEESAQVSEFIINNAMNAIFQPAEEEVRVKNN